MKDVSWRQYRRWLLGLLIARAIVPLLLWKGLPDQLRFWRAYFEDTDLEYFRLATALAHGQAVSSFRTIGYPLTLVPWIWLTRATTLDRVVDLVVLFQSCVVAVGVLWLLADITRRCTGRHGTALLTAAAWACMPALAMLLPVNPSYAHWGPGLHWSRAAYLLGMKVTADIWNLWWCLLGVWATTRAWVDRSSRDCWALLAGLSVGCATLTMLPSSALLAMGGLWLAARQWRSAALFLGAFLLVASAQIWHDLASGGAGYLAVWRYEAGLLASPELAPAPWSLSYLWPNVMAVFHKAGAAGSGVLLLIVTLAGVGYRRLSRAAPVGSVLALWIAPIGLTWLGYWAFKDNALRLSLPWLPALCLLVIVAVETTLAGRRG